MEFYKHQNVYKTIFILYLNSASKLGFVEKNEIKIAKHRNEISA